MEAIVRRLAILALALCASAAVFANKKPPAAPVNLNTATSEELQTVPGIGPATAEKILLMRKNYGAFKSVDDLLAIKGLGPKRLEKMRKYLTVGKSATGHPATPGTKSQSPNKEELPTTDPTSIALDFPNPLLPGDT